MYKKNYFFYFTHSFLQNTHISLSILHIYSIKYLLFFHFLLFYLSPKPISLKTTLSLTDLNHHHTNHQILAPTKHSFITLFITSFITSSLQWVPKVDPPLLRLRRLIGASFSSRRSSHPLFLLVSPPFSCFSVAIIFLFLKQWLQKKVLKSTRNPLLLRYRIFWRI